MKLTRNKISKLHKVKNQSRRKYRRKHKYKKRKLDENRTFRKRKPFNLRTKTLKNRKHKGHKRRRRRGGARANKIIDSNIMEGGSVKKEDLKLGDRVKLTGDFTARNMKKYKNEIGTVTKKGPNQISVEFDKDNEKFSEGTVEGIDYSQVTMEKKRSQQKEGKEDEERRTRMFQPAGTWSPPSRDVPIPKVDEERKSKGPTPSEIMDNTTREKEAAAEEKAKADAIAQKEAEEKAKKEEEERKVREEEAAAKKKVEEEAAAKKKVEEEAAIQAKKLEELNDLKEKFPINTIVKISGIPVKEGREATINDMEGVVVGWLEGAGEEENRVKVTLATDKATNRVRNIPPSYLTKVEPKELERRDKMKEIEMQLSDKKKKQQETVKKQQETVKKELEAAVKEKEILLEKAQEKRGKAKIGVRQEELKIARKNLTDFIKEEEDEEIKDLETQKKTIEEGARKVEEEAAAKKKAQEEAAAKKKAEEEEKLSVIKEAGVALHKKLIKELSEKIIEYKKVGGQMNNDTMPSGIEGRTQILERAVEKINNWDEGKLTGEGAETLLIAFERAISFMDTFIYDAKNTANCNEFIEVYRKLIQNTYDHWGDLLSLGGIEIKNEISDFKNKWKSAGQLIRDIENQSMNKGAKTGGKLIENIQELNMKGGVIGITPKQAISTRVMTWLKRGDTYTEENQQVFVDYKLNKEDYKWGEGGYNNGNNKIYNFIELPKKKEKIDLTVLSRQLWDNDKKKYDILNLNEDKLSEAEEDINKIDLFGLKKKSGQKLEHYNKEYWKALVNANWACIKDVLEEQELLFRTEHIYKFYFMYMEDLIIKIYNDKEGKVGEVEKVEKVVEKLFNAMFNFKDEDDLSDKLEKFKEDVCKLSLNQNIKVDWQQVRKNFEYISALYLSLFDTNFGPNGSVSLYTKECRWRDPYTSMLGGDRGEGGEGGETYIQTPAMESFRF